MCSVTLCTLRYIHCEGDLGRTCSMNDEVYIISYHIIVYHTISYHIIYYIMLYYVMLCYIMLYYVILYYIILYYIILYYIILYYIILYYIILYYYKKFKIYIKTLKMFLHVSILRSSSRSISCSLLNLYIKTISDLLRCTYAVQSPYSIRRTHKHTT